MYPAKIDVAVLLLFFTRPQQTALVFEQIKKARPSKLFLYQDGPRAGKNDMDGINACRRIVEDIDWECEIYKMYQEKNYGCDPSEYISQKWMFSIVDKGIILEDDDVPSQSFFFFCKELLDKYEHDLRISMIAGMCHLDQVNLEVDYFFSKHGPIWGWATWKRTIDMWDSTYSFLNNKYAVNTLKYNGDFPQSLENTVRKHLASGKEHYESINRMERLLNNQLVIIPTKNMISNIGLTPDAVHNTTPLKDLPPTAKKLYNKKTFEYTFPLKHPQYIIEDKILSEAISKSIHLTYFDKLFIWYRRTCKIFHI